MRISDWSSDVCSSDLAGGGGRRLLPSAALWLFALGDPAGEPAGRATGDHLFPSLGDRRRTAPRPGRAPAIAGAALQQPVGHGGQAAPPDAGFFLDPRGCAGGARSGAGGMMAGEMPLRSEEHTSELQSLMSISYAGFCL